MNQLDIAQPFPIFITAAGARQPQPQPQPLPDPFDCTSGDCACSLPVPSYSRPVSNPHFHSLALKQQQDARVLPVNDQFLACFGPFQNFGVLNRAGLQVWKEFASYNTPAGTTAKLNSQFPEDHIRRTIAHLYQQNALVHQNQVSPTLQANPQTLVSWLHITDRCNLRCDYCYLPHKKQDMSFEMGSAAIDAALRSAARGNYHSLQVKYAGGEPMILFPLVTALQEYALVQTRVQGFTLDGVILSNGTLINETIIRDLRRLNLRLMISLDELENVDSCQRPYANGANSAAAAMHSIRNCLDQGLIPHISITVSSKNVQTLPELMAWILEHRLPFHLNFYRENDLARDRNSLQLDQERIISGMLQVYKTIEQNLPMFSLLEALADLANFSTPHSKTCGVGQNYMVFDHQGNISKCQMQRHSHVTNVNSPDPLLQIQNDSHGIQNLDVSHKEPCNSCEWRYWCAGGCPLVTFRATGRYDLNSPNCEIYKALYPEVIRLEAIRLLKVKRLPVS